ncbi:TniQ family protein [Ornithinimicrobium faecis]|uniref:TniQ family protein n=1 Tax=Ornithinimicrobium faecis TaxID=2934158 RepID=UPI003CE501A8
MTRLPLALAPLQDEAWPSYLTRQAAQHGTTLAGMGSHLGLRDARGRWPGRFGVTMAETEAARVAPMLSLAPKQVQRMQLAAYHQLAFDLGGLAHNSAIGGTRATVHAAWVWLAGTTFCPLCLVEDDGVWRLMWRIPWITTCIRHEVGFHGTCHACGGVPGLGNRFHGSAPPRVAAAPDGRRCTGPTPVGHVCGADLSAQPTVQASPERLMRAKRMADLVAGQRGVVSGTERTSLQALRGWQSAIGIAVRLGVVDSDGWGRTHRWANPPRDPDLIDRLLQAVEPLVTAPDRTTGADVLDGWLRDADIRSPHVNTFDRITQTSAALQPVINELLGRHGRAHTVIQRRLTSADGAPFGERDWGVDDIPQLVWPCALPEHLRHSTKPDQRILRAVVSMILARMFTDACDWVAAGRALGFPADKSRNWTRYAFAAKWGIKTDLLDASHALGQKLPKRPRRVSFHRRSQVSGFGSRALADAQSPRCRDQGGSAWCPCYPQPTAP